MGGDDIPTSLCELFLFTKYLISSLTSSLLYKSCLLFSFKSATGITGRGAPRSYGGLITKDRGMLGPRGRNVWAAEYPHRGMRREERMGVVIEGRLGRG